MSMAITLNSSWAGGGRSHESTRTVVTTEPSPDLRAGNPGRRGTGGQRVLPGGGAAVRRDTELSRFAVVGWEHCAGIGAGGVCADVGVSLVSWTVLGGWVGTVHRVHDIAEGVALGISGRGVDVGLAAAGGGGAVGAG